MTSYFMTQTQRSLEPGVALRLPPAAVLRHLRVREGRVWVTVTGGGLDDVWLDAGDEMALAPRAEAVVEGWPRARFELVEALAMRPASHNAGHVRVPLAHRSAA